jgi:PhzF family phenazine biosynthesis protein
MQRRFAQVDVFTDVPYRGNPLAVVIDGDDVTDDEMQRFANWTNLSETTFLQKPTHPDADYRVRIFTGSMELPFAGHPTLGTCHTFLEQGGVPKHADVVVQECKGGLIEVRRTATGLAFGAPPLLRSGPLDPSTLDEVVRMLGIPASDIVDANWIDNGPGWIGILLKSDEQVLKVQAINGDLKIGVIGPTTDTNHTHAYEVRAFFPSKGIVFEDPVTGSLNAGLAQWLTAIGVAKAPYVVRQGTALGRAGRIDIRADAGHNIWVGGSTITCIRGTVEL